MAGRVSGLQGLTAPGSSFVVDDKMCQRCHGISLTDVISLCLNCFYETDQSFQCDSCGDHETVQGGLYHISGSKKCGECSEAAIRLSRIDEVNELKREIASHKGQIAELKEQKAVTSWIKGFESQLEIYEKKLESLTRETEERLLNRGLQKLSNDDKKKLAYHERMCKLMKHKTKESLLDRALPKLSNAHVDVSRPPPIIEDPSTWMTFTLP